MIPSVACAHNCYTHFLRLPDGSLDRFIRDEEADSVVSIELGVSWTGSCNSDPTGRDDAVDTELFEDVVCHVQALGQALCWLTSGFSIHQMLCDCLSIVMVVS